MAAVNGIISFGINLCRRKIGLIVDYYYYYYGYRRRRRRRITQVKLSL
jgi:hypothetical protein